MENKNMQQIKKISTLAMLVAMAFAVTAVCRIPLMPAAPFLKYDPKDVIIAIAGFIFGPVEAVIAALLVAALEMVTIGTTGLWGFVMNFLSSAAFVLPSAILYRHRRNIKGALIGLVLGIVCMTGAMMLWNYLITPIYQGMPRAAVAEMLLPVFLPFNALKSTINAVLTLLIYKPVVKALRKAKLVPPSELKTEK